MDSKTKCYSVNLEAAQVEQLTGVKEKTGESQSRILAESLRSGLNSRAFFLQGKALFMVKVRINLDSMAELGEKLQNQELQTNRILFTYCDKEDPTVGTSLWIAQDKRHFHELFAPHKKYYRDVIDVREVITPEESMALLMASMA